MSQQNQSNFNQDLINIRSNNKKSVKRKFIFILLLSFWVVLMLFILVIWSDAFLEVLQNIYNKNQDKDVKDFIHDCLGNIFLFLLSGHLILLIISVIVKLLNRKLKMKLFFLISIIGIAAIFIIATISSYLYHSKMIWAY